MWLTVQMHRMLWTSTTWRNWRFLAGLVEDNLAVKARSSKLGTGRAAAHCSSQTDNDEAFMAGQAAVKRLYLARPTKW